MNRKGFIRLCMILCWILAAGVEKGSAAETKEDSSTVHIAWSEFDGRTHQIFFARIVDGAETGKTQLSSGNRINLVPSLSSDDRGRIWVVWSALDGAKTHLNTAWFNGDSWKITEYATGMVSNTAPAVAVDPDGLAWLVWAGFDGQDDDIFFSRWNDGAWESPARIHADNSVPDILPVIGIGSNGLPWVRWSGLEGAGYRSFTSYWQGKNWAEKVEQNTSSSSDDSGGIVSDSLLRRLPEIVKEPDKASIHLPRATRENRSYHIRGHYGRMRPTAE